MTKDEWTKDEGRKTKRRRTMTKDDDEKQIDDDLGFDETIVTNSVTIFLASSSELWRERQFIGNRMRMLNVKITEKLQTDAICSAK